MLASVILHGENHLVVGADDLVLNFRAKEAVNLVGRRASNCIDIDACAFNIFCDHFLPTGILHDGNSQYNNENNTRDNG